jgi:DNA-binding transcriptional regulator YbjK
MDNFQKSGHSLAMSNDHGALYFETFGVGLSKGDQRKLQIIEAAIESFATKGIANTSLESIGKQLKVRRSHIAYYFSTLEELIEDAIKFVAATAQAVTVERLKTAHSSEERLAAFVEAPFEWCERYPRHAAMMMLFYHLCTYQPGLRKMHSAVRKAGLQRIEQIVLLSCKSKPSATRVTKIAQVCGSIQNLITGNIIEHLTMEQGKNLQKRKAETLATARELVANALA